MPTDLLGQAAKPVKIKVYHLQFPEKALVINETYSRVAFPVVDS